MLGNPHDELRDFSGLARSRPGLAGLMTVFLLSLGGFPPTAGFIGKWYIFSAAVQEGHFWLAIVGVLSSVVSVFFYLRIVVMMYMTEGSDMVRPRVPATAMAGLALATIGWACPLTVNEHEAVFIDAGLSPSIVPDHAEVRLAWTGEGMNWDPLIEELEAANHPQKAEMGTRMVPFSRELSIEADDFTD